MIFSIIVPIYNEEKTILDILSRLEKFKIFDTEKRNNCNR